MSKKISLSEAPVIEDPITWGLFDPPEEPIVEEQPLVCYCSNCGQHWYSIFGKPPIKCGQCELEGRTVPTNWLSSPPDKHMTKQNKHGQMSLF